MKKLMILMLTASPAMAETEGFVTLYNTTFVTMLAFLLFVAILIWQKVPALVGGLLDKRALQIKSDLDEARALRDEAKALLASYDAKMTEVQAQSARIIDAAKADAQAAAVQAKADLADSIARRLASAKDQIASAEASAIAQVRDQAITVAVAAAGAVLAQQSTAATAAASIDAAIAVVDAKFH